MAIKGTVRMFNNDKGFGFISSPGRQDIFVHFSAIQGSGFKSLNVSDEVEFYVEADTSWKGKRAVNLVFTKSGSSGGLDR